jgi:4-amino-4-deoxy-L-arabinose transferase-like glycosyltransferase
LPGLMIMLIIASAWYVPVIARHGWSFINEFFISHHFQRFTTSKFQHPGPVYYFVPVILAGVFPWTAFLVSALSRLRFSQLRAGDPRDRLRWFCAIWIVVPLAFFSLSSSKLPGYILPVVPAAAFLIAGELEALLEAGASRALSRILYVTAALMMVVGVTGFIFARREMQPQSIGNVLILVVSGVSAAAILSFSMVRKYAAAVASLVAGCAVGFALASHVYLPAVAEKESLRSLAVLALREMRTGEKILGYYYFHHSLTYYTNARSFYDERGNVIIADSPDQLLDKVREAGSVLIVTRQPILKVLMTDRRLHVRPIGRHRAVVLARVMRAD